MKTTRATQRLQTLRRHLTSATTKQETVCVLGAGSFGSAITRVCAQAPATRTVNLHCNRASVAHEINTYRTNRQYGVSISHPFPRNVIATHVLKQAITDANMVVVVVPSSYLPPLLAEIAQHRHLLAKDSMVVSLVKSLHYNDKAGVHALTTMCEEITQALQLPTVCLSGPNIYTEMIRDEFAEATIGHLDTDYDAAVRAQQVFTTETFRASLCNDRKGVELCGGLKNVISLAAGFCEGLHQGANTKAAVIRLGLKEMALFSSHLGVNSATVYEESSGVGDLLLTCTVGRGRQLAKSFVDAYETKGACVTVEESKARWAELEQETLNGMKLPDWSNAKVVHDYMANVGFEPISFPLFTAIYNIAYLGAPPNTILDALKTAVASSTASASFTSTSSLPVITAPNSTVNLAGKRALVTGAASGIGRAIAEHLSECGVHVVGLDINKEALNELKATLKCEILACDLLNITALRDTVTGYMDQHGPIDLLVNCAGVAKFEPFFDTTPKAFDLQMGINVKALFYLTQLITQRMVKANIAGSVVHISSQSSTLPLADHLIYSSSKATVDHMARIQAFELGPHGIRVNTVRPTVVLTKLALEQWDAEDLEVMKNQIPLKKLATTKDVAMAVSWLLSDEASMVTGSTLAVDGGRSMGGYGL